MGQTKVLYFMQLFLPYILYSENSKLESQSSKNKIVTKYEGWKDGGICQIFFFFSAFL